MINFLCGSIKSATLLLCVGYISSGYAQTSENTTLNSQVTAQSIYIELKNGSATTHIQQFVKQKAEVKTSGECPFTSVHEPECLSEDVLLPHYEPEKFWQCIPVFLYFSYAQQSCVLPEEVEDMFEHCNF
ncbi:hypothetical protein [Pseudoalteromonas sp. MMG022]|uniref:hypothetical protein n=1 Tax=Pseudoalteromonas sp. MMG022 TaxID=2909978 RepID=UPI001F1C3E11|nr:hypothetical protein [Pseudoalteromonas sp. MMG022]MCF6434062.1 hypothetical protein [Pseudoalteromonas sp. MMG022]